MHKKEKKKNKNHAKEKQLEQGDTQRVLSVIRSLGAEANLKKLFPQLERKLSQEKIILALGELDRKGKIKIEQKGKIKLLESEKAEHPQSSIRNPKFLYGIVDITRNGAAFVAVEGFEKDIFISPRLVHNAMQGDEVKVRIISHT